MSIVSPFIGDFLTPVGQPLVLSPLVNGLRAEFDQQQFRINGGGVLFDTAFNITRSSSKYEFGTGAQTGLFVEVPPNTPAYKHDPVTGAPLGLSVEGSATNLLTQSLFANGLNDATIRGGLLTLETFSELFSNGAVNGIGFGYNGSTTTFAYKVYDLSSETGNFCFSAIVEMDDLGDFVLGQSASDSNTDAILVFKGSFNSANTAVKSLGQGRHLVWGYADSLVGTSNNFGFVKYGGNSSRTFKVTQYQLEQGTKPTSPIITGASTLTRAADIVTSDAATFGDWYRTSGTLTVTAKANVGDIVARLGSIEIVADVDTEKEYSVTYTTDPLATELELLPSGNGYIKQVTFKE